MDLQQQRKLTLEHEIRILEQNKGNIDRDLERLEATKKQEYTQYTAEIKELTKRRDALLTQVQQLRLDIETITAAYQTAKQEILTYKQEQLADADKRLEQSKQSAKGIEDQAFKDKEEAATLLLKAKNKERELSDWEQVVVNENAENRRVRLELTTEQERQAAQLSKFNDTIEKLDKQVETLSDDIAILEAKKVQLSKEEQEQRTAKGAAEAALVEREAACSRMETAQKNITTLQAQKAKDLEDKERLLKDRADTLDRATIEMRQKGVQI